MKEINEYELKDVTGCGIESSDSEDRTNSQQIIYPTDGNCPEGYILKNGLCNKETLYVESGIFKKVGAESKL